MGVPAFGGRYVPGSAIAPAASFASLSPVAGFAAFHIANTVFPSHNQFFHFSNCFTVCEKFCGFSKKSYIVAAETSLRPYSRVSV